jgi:hypothetical protein
MWWWEMIQFITLAPHRDNLFLEYDPIRGGVIAETPIAPSDPRGI